MWKRVLPCMIFDSVLEECTLSIGVERESAPGKLGSLVGEVRIRFLQAVVEREDVRSGRTAV